ncbi:hypothetical protein GGR58DRAFT_153342 [Xylaria digitata]|nr:hypothetical protein GGR58DRAFT_153342 [Xylaria digitata]
MLPTNMFTTIFTTGARGGLWCPNLCIRGSLGPHQNRESPITSCTAILFLVSSIFLYGATLSCLHCTGSSQRERERRDREGQDRTDLDYFFFAHLIITPDPATPPFLFAITSPAPSLSSLSLLFLPSLFLFIQLTRLAIRQLPT